MSPVDGVKHYSDQSLAVGILGNAAALFSTSITLNQYEKAVSKMKVWFSVQVVSILSLGDYAAMVKKLIKVTPILVDLNLAFGDGVLITSSQKK